MTRARLSCILRSISSAGLSSRGQSFLSRIASLVRPHGWSAFLLKRNLQTPDPWERQASCFLPMEGRARSRPFFGILFSRPQQCLALRMFALHLAGESPASPALFVFSFLPRVGSGWAYATASERESGNTASRRRVLSCTGFDCGDRAAPPDRKPSRAPTQDLRFPECYCLYTGRGHTVPVGTPDMGEGSRSKERIPQCQDRFPVTSLGRWACRIDRLGIANPKSDGWRGSPGGMRRRSGCS